MSTNDADQPAAPGAERTPLWTWLILLAVGLAILVPGSRAAPLLDRDEPRFARATVEMEQNDTWVVPTFNDRFRPDKPPLTYWWMRLNYAVLGHNELGARAHSILSAMAMALVILGMGRHFWGWREAFWSALGWLTIVQVWVHGRFALADMPMILGLTLAHWAAWRLLTAPQWQRWGPWFWVLWLGLAFGALAKGPLVFFSLGLTLLLLRFVFQRRTPLPWGRLQALPGVFICLLLVALWGLPALELTGGRFWTEGIGTHVVDRGLGAFNDRQTYPIIYYIVTAFVSLFPWFGRVGGAWRSIRDDWDAQTAFLVSWIVGLYLLFAFYATQLPHYVLPAFPAVMLLLFRRPRLDATFAAWFYRIYHGIFMALLFALGLWLSFGPVFTPVKPFLLGAVAVLLGLQFCAMSWEQRRTWGIGVGVAMASVGSMLAGVGLHNVALSPIIAPLVQDIEGPVTAVGYTEPSLVYYGERTWQFFPGDSAGLQAALALEPEFVVVQRETANLNKLLGMDDRSPTPTTVALEAEKLFGPAWIRYSAEGLNIGASRWVKVDIYRRIPGSEPGQLVAK